MTFEDAVRWLKNGKYISSLSWLDTHKIKNPQLRVTKVNPGDTEPKVVGAGKYLRYEVVDGVGKIMAEHAAWKSKIVDDVELLEASPISKLGNYMVSTEEMLLNDWFVLN